MATISDFLPTIVYNRMEQEQQVLQQVIDFSRFGAASGDTVQAIRIPKGMLVERVALVVHTTQTTVTLAVGDSASGTQYLAAQTLTDLRSAVATEDGAASSVESTRKFYGADNILTLLVGGADAATAVVSVIVSGVLSAKTSAETAVEA